MTDVVNIKENVDIRATYLAAEDVKFAASLL
jgi:hypothetical protein